MENSAHFLSGQFIYLGRHVLHPLYDLFTFFLYVLDSVLYNLELSCSSRQRYAGMSPDLVLSNYCGSVGFQDIGTMRLKVWSPPPIQPTKSFPLILMPSHGPVS